MGRVERVMEDLRSTEPTSVSFSLDVKSTNEGGTPPCLPLLARSGPSRRTRPDDHAKSSVAVVQSRNSTSGLRLASRPANFATCS